MGSNCSPWQKGNVAARMAIVREVLASLRGRKGGRFNVTQLAESICRTIRAVEIREAESLGRKYKPIHSSTLLRPDGSYRPLLDGFLIESGLRSANPESHVSNPVAKRLLASKDLKIRNVCWKLERALKKIDYLDKRVPHLNTPETPVKAEIDSLGSAAVVLLDVIIGTGLFKLDEEAGDLLYVTRSRKVAMARLQIAPILNWKKRRSATRSED
jgi:hypothetical protein